MPKIIARHPSGFRVELDDVGRDRLEDAIDWLTQHGYRPDITGGDQWQRTPDGEPICGRHNVVMTRRERQGDRWWSHPVTHRETAEVRYCRGFAHPSKGGDGFEI